MRGSQRILCVLWCVVLMSMVINVSKAKDGNADKEIVKQRQDQAKKLLNSLERRDYESAITSFNDELKAALPAEKLKAVWEAILKQVGPLQQIEEPSWLAQSGYVVLICRLHCGETTINMRVAFDEDSRIAGLYFVPDDTYSSAHYVDADKFEVLACPISKGEHAITGTLTRPKGKGPFVGIILVPGSGNHDKDESIGPNKPFRDLAEGLASRGVAVLRYPKRSFLYPSSFESEKQFTLREEVIEDAVAAVKALRCSGSVDPDGIFLLGHSLGGMVAPRIAKECPTLKGLIIMSGNARSIEDMILAQTTYIAKLDGDVSPEEKSHLEELSKAVSEIRQIRDSKGSNGQAILGVPQIYWRDLTSYSPIKSAAELNTPFLFLYGERDYQVTQEDESIWRKTLGHRKNVTFINYKGLNHLMMEGEGVPGPKEYFIPGHLSLRVIEDVAKWVKDVQKQQLDSDGQASSPR